MDPQSRLDPRNYTLSEIQLSHLVGEDIGTRRTSNLDEEVDGVVSNLDDRLQYLLEDISLFYGKGRMGNDTQREVWDQIPDLDRTDRLYDPPTMIRGIDPRTSENIKLAIHLGHILRILYKSSKPEFDDRLIAAGAILGLQGAFLKDSWDGTSSNEAFLDDLPDGDEYFQTFRMPSKETLQSLDDAMEGLESSIEITPATETTNDELRDQLEASNLTTTGPLLSEGENILDDTGYPAIASVVETVIRELESDPRIRAIEQLTDQIESDINELDSSMYLKAEAINVFYEFYKAGEYADLDSGSIAKDADTKGHQVSKLQNDFLGENQPWTDRPLLFEDQVGLSPTDYGTLLGQVLTPEEYNEVDEMPENAAYSIPSRQEIITLCHNYLFGGAGDDNEDLIEAVLEDQIMENERSG